MRIVDIMIIGSGTFLDNAKVEYNILRHMSCLFLFTTSSLLGLFPGFAYGEDDTLV